jgi:hypothetical protein
VKLLIIDIAKARIVRAIAGCDTSIPDTFQIILSKKLIMKNIG